VIFLDFLDAINNSVFHFPNGLQGMTHVLHDVVVKAFGLDQMILGLAMAQEEVDCLGGARVGQQAGAVVLAERSRRVACESPTIRIGRISKA
jgi:hypothetical protein